MNSRFAENIKSLIVKSRLTSVVRHLNQQPVILFYHGVSLSPNPIIESESISVDDFVKHLHYLIRHYNIVSIDEFVCLYSEHRLTGNEVSITFDDGYKNVLHTAVPVLSEFKIPYSIYLTTNNITHSTLFPTTINRLVIRASSLKTIELDCLKQRFELSSDSLKGRAQEFISMQLKSQPIEVVNKIVCELESKISAEELCELREKYNSVEPLNWEEVKQLSNNPLCTIGSHGMDHICCHEKQPLDEIKQQMIGSKYEIENKLGVNCSIFSYPNGNFTEESNKLLKENGYEFGLSTRRLNVYQGNIYSIPRLYVPYDYNRFIYSLVTYPY